MNQNKFLNYGTRMHGADIGPRKFHLTEEDGRVKSYHNIELVVNAADTNKYSVKRTGAFGDSEEEYDYSIEGAILVQPSDERHGYHKVVIEYFDQGERQGTLLKPAGDAKGKVSLTGEKDSELDALCAQYFPDSIITGIFQLATETPLPGDVGESDFFRMFQTMMERNSEVNRNALAYNAFKEAYGGKENDR